MVSARHGVLRSGARIWSVDMMEITVEATVEFTPVYDDVTARSLESEFARLEGEMLGERWRRTISFRFR